METAEDLQTHARYLVSSVQDPWHVGTDPDQYLIYGSPCYLATNFSFSFVLIWKFTAFAQDQASNFQWNDIV